MRQYIVKRLLQMIPVLVGISMLIFLMIAITPGDVITANLSPKTSPERKAELRHQLHLDEPKIVQYGYWAGSALKGDLGTSFTYKKPVISVINDYVWNSFYLNVVVMIFSILIAIPIGVVSATKQYSIFDKFFTVFALIGMSIPTFFFALLAIKAFAVNIKLFPVSGMHMAGSNLAGFANLKDVMHHMFLPAAILILGSLAGLMRFTRSSMLEVIRQDYVRTARSKGLREKVVVYKHALRNAMIPVITILAGWIPGLFGGAIMTETVFNWPGIGIITLQSVNTRDYYLLMGINMILAVLTLLGNLMADITYAIVDPRIRLK